MKAHCAELQQTAPPRLPKGTTGLVDGRWAMGGRRVDEDIDERPREKSDRAHDEAHGAPGSAA
jgi:hypothetical protein